MLTKKLINELLDTLHQESFKEPELIFPTEVVCRDGEPKKEEYFTINGNELRWCGYRVYLQNNDGTWHKKYGK